MTAPDPDPPSVARALLRATRQASLATTADNQPHAALVSPAFLPDFTPILLLSSLARHTTHLRANPHCALLCIAASPDSNPQTIPRVSLSCTAAQVDRTQDGPLRAHYLAHHPYAALYADFGDFALWRLTIHQAHLVQGFARAFTLGPEDFGEGKARPGALPLDPATWRLADGRRPTSR